MSQTLWQSCASMIGKLGCNFDSQGFSYGALKWYTTTHKCFPILYIGCTVKYFANTRWRLTLRSAPSPRSCGWGRRGCGGRWWPSHLHNHWHHYALVMKSSWYILSWPRAGDCYLDWWRVFSFQFKNAKLVTGQVIHSSNNADLLQKNEELLRVSYKSGRSGRCKLACNEGIKYFSYRGTWKDHDLFHLPLFQKQTDPLSLRNLSNKSPYQLCESSKYFWKCDLTWIKDLLSHFWVSLFNFTLNLVSNMKQSRKLQKCVCIHSLFSNSQFALAAVNILETPATPMLPQFLSVSEKWMKWKLETTFQQTPPTSFPNLMVFISQWNRVVCLCK